MSVYLRDIPLPEAEARLRTALVEAGLWQVLGKEVIPLNEQAAGRVLSTSVWAKISSPHYHASAMDGFAVLESNTAEATPSSPISLIYGSQTVYVDTGDPIPVWANAVIPIENVESLNKKNLPAENPRTPYSIRIREAVAPWKYIRPLGEDIVATELVLSAGEILRPVDLGAIAACGYDRIEVAKKPSVAILPTGSELVEIGKPLSMGRIIEYNSIVMAAQINSWGGDAQRYPITADKFDALCDRVNEAAKAHDLILLNAGSSAGSEDFSSLVVEKLGRLFVHGVAVRPGHPVIIGMIDAKDGRQVPIFGVPGYPVSAALTGEIFIEPLLAKWTGRKPHEPITVRAQLTRKMTSPPGDDDYIRMVVGKVAGKTLAAPLSRGAGVITSLVRADGVAIVPRGSQGMLAGESVEVRLYRSPNEIERTILAVGSHDLTLDLLAQHLALRSRRLASANVGSLAGLIALKRGEAHLSGSHLLDTQTGEYNLSYIRKYLPELPVSVIAFVGRQQGLLIQKNNPKSIKDLQDLTRKDVRYINRQRGAGTRVLLDYQLGQMGIDPALVNGYDQEEYTHLAVAAAISSGRADCGLGIHAAANALGLDFIALYRERYDLVIPEIYMQSPLLAPLFDILYSRDFKDAISALPGYDVESMGVIVSKPE